MVHICRMQALRGCLFSCDNLWHLNLTPHLHSPAIPMFFLHNQGSNRGQVGAQGAHSLPHSCPPVYRVPQHERGPIPLIQDVFALSLWMRQKDSHLSWIPAFLTNWDVSMGWEGSGLLPVAPLSVNEPPSEDGDHTVLHWSVEGVTDADRGPERFILLCCLRHLWEEPNPGAEARSTEPQSSPTSWAPAPGPLQSLCSLATWPEHHSGLLYPSTQSSCISSPPRSITDHLWWCLPSTEKPWRVSLWLCKSARVGIQNRDFVLVITLYDCFFFCFWPFSDFSHRSHITFVF